MRQWIAVALAGCLLLATSAAYAGAPVCHNHTSGPYCSYTGKVRQAYVNSGNLYLLYFDTAMDLGQPSGVGINGVTTGAAAAFLLSDNPEFARSLYATLLAAQARDATITVQMRGRYGGYLKIDRIWIHE